MNQKRRVVIGLGTNLGDRDENLKRAARRIIDDVLENATASSIFESKPWGLKEQPDFLNAALLGDSDWKPPAILSFLKNLEKELGRTTTVKNGPRVIDLDLLAYGEEKWEGEGLVVPHPGIADRDFVLLPFQELWPDWKHPVLNRTITELALEFQTRNETSAKPFGGRGGLIP